MSGHPSDSHWLFKRNSSRTSKLLFHKDLNFSLIVNSPVPKSHGGFNSHTTYFSFLSSWRTSSSQSPLHTSSLILLQPPSHFLLQRKSSNPRIQYLYQDLSYYSTIDRLIHPFLTYLRPLSQKYFISCIFFSPLISLKRVGTHIPSHPIIPPSFFYFIFQLCILKFQSFSSTFIFFLPAYFGA